MLHPDVIQDALLMVVIDFDKYNLSLPKKKRKKGVYYFIETTKLPCILALNQLLY